MRSAELSLLQAVEHICRTPDLMRIKSGKKIGCRGKKSKHRPPVFQILVAFPRR